MAALLREIFNSLKCFYFIVCLGFFWSFEAICIVLCYHKVGLKKVGY